MVMDAQGLAALSGAWLELCARTGALQQAWAEQWIRYWAETTGEASARVTPTIEDVADTADASHWPSQWRRADEAAWQATHASVASLERFTQTAMDAQAEYAEGMRQALHIWQRDCARALHAQRSAMPLYTTIREALNAMELNAIDPGPAQGTPIHGEAGTSKRNVRS